MVGKVKEGELCTNSNWNEVNTIKIKNFTLGFSEELEMWPTDFPKPILQLDFDAIIPWVLEEKPDDD